MYLPENQILTVNIVANIIGHSLTPDDKKNVESQVGKYLQKLFNELTINLRYTFSILPADQNIDNESMSIGVKIDGTNCRIPRNLHLEEPIETKTLATWIMDIVHLNRNLIIIPGFSDFFRNDNISEFRSNLIHLPSESFSKLLALMVKNGFKLERCIDINSDSTTIAWDYKQCYEAIIADVDSTSIIVRYNTAYEKFSKSLSKGNLDKMIPMMQEGLYYELGIVFPIIHYEPDESFADNEFQFQLNDVTYPSIFGLKYTEYLVNDTVEGLKAIKVKGKKAINPVNDSECAIINKNKVKACHSAKLTTWNALGFLILCLSNLLRKSAGSFLTSDIVRNDLESLRDTSPDLTNIALTQFDTNTITWILRELLREEISIRNLRNILDGLLCANGITNVDFSRYIVLQPEGTNLVYSEQKDVCKLEITEYSDHIRAAALKGYISHKYTRGGNTLVVYLLDPAIENLIRNLRSKEELLQIEKDKLINAIYFELEDLPATSQYPVILTSYEIRHKLRKMIEIEFPNLAVISYQELSNTIYIRPISRIAME